jgi:hypothetical protein
MKRRFCQVAKAAKISTIQEIYGNNLSIYLDLVELSLILRFQIFADYGEKVRYEKSFVVKLLSEKRRKKTWQDEVKKFSSARTADGRHESLSTAVTGNECTVPYTGKPIPRQKQKRRVLRHKPL